MLNPWTNNLMQQIQVSHAINNLQIQPQRDLLKDGWGQNISVDEFADGTVL